MVRLLKVLVAGVAVAAFLGAAACSGAGSGADGSDGGAQDG
jgi:hypothetical protein